MKPGFEYFQSRKNRQWYWRLRAGNGRIVAQSEGYRTKAGVQKGVHATRAAAVIAYHLKKVER